MSLSTYSRYWTTRIVTIAGIEQFVEWNPPVYGKIDERLYIVTRATVNRPDLISQFAYGVPDLWWVVLHYNGIADPFSLQPGDRLKLPTAATIKLILQEMQAQGPRPILDAAEATGSETLPAAPVGLSTPVVIPPFVAPLSPAQSNSAITIPSTNAESAGFNFGFTLPIGLTGLVQFQIEVATDAGFTNVIMSRLTTASQANWYYYDPYVNSQAGGYVAFPALGIDGTLFSGVTVYYSVQITDPLVPSTLYYIRYRTWVNQLEGVWYVPAPILF
jgi:hypothetical protein